MNDNPIALGFGIGIGFSFAMAIITLLVKVIGHICTAIFNYMTDK